MDKVVENVKHVGLPEKPAVRPIAGELTLADLRAVVGGGTVSPISNGRNNPPNQKTRFGNSPG